MTDLLDLLQWPAMAVTVAASWLVASRRGGRRQAAFWLFLASNVLWVAWGLTSGATALVLLQFCLAGLNLRGARKADAQVDDDGGARAPADAHPATRAEPHTSEPSKSVR